jgi:hypothetical protein
MVAEIFPAFASRFREKASLSRSPQTKTPALRPGFGWEKFDQDQRAAS